LDIVGSIILGLSRLRPEQGAVVLAGRLDNSGWDALVHAAIRNEVAPLVYENVKGLGSVPAGAKEALRAAYLQTVQRNTVAAEETLRVLEHLRARSIPAMPLKGPLFSEAVFGSPALYPSSDIDILVRPVDIGRAGAALRELGYAEDRLPERDMFEAHYHVSFVQARHRVEVHWNLVKRYFDADPEFWWEEADALAHGGRGYPVPSPERYILYLVFRLFSHEFSPLKFQALLAGFINANSGLIDWERLMAHAKQLRMRRLTLFTLALVSDLLGADVPRPFASTRIAGYGPLKQAVLGGLFKEAAGSARRLLYLALLDSPLEMLGAALRRVFPGKGELRLRYGLPEGSTRLYLYYVLNPVLLPWMLLRRKPR
jgi:hypothetical protein